MKPITINGQQFELVGYDYDTPITKGLFLLKLADTKPKPAKRWRAERNGDYFTINGTGEVTLGTETFSVFDKDKYELGNYFQTEEQAKLAAEAFKELLKAIHMAKDSYYGILNDLNDAIEAVRAEMRKI